MLFGHGKTISGHEGQKHEEVTKLFKNLTQL